MRQRSAFEVGPVRRKVVGQHDDPLLGELPEGHAAHDAGGFPNRVDPVQRDKTDPSRLDLCPALFERRGRPP